MTNPYLMIDLLVADATDMLRMPMDTEREVALCESGIRLTAQAWPTLDKNFIKEALAKIQAARESGEHTAEPIFRYRLPGDTGALLRNLADTIVRLPVKKQAGMSELIQFATNYPKPLLYRYRAEQAQTEQQAQSGPQL